MKIGRPAVATTASYGRHVLANQFPMEEYLAFSLRFHHYIFISFTIASLYPLLFPCDKFPDGINKSWNAKLLFRKVLPIYTLASNV